MPPFFSLETGLKTEYPIGYQVELFDAIAQGKMNDSEFLPLNMYRRKSIFSAGRLASLDALLHHSYL